MRPHFIDTLDRDVSGDILGLMMILLALAVALALVTMSVRQIRKTHRGPRSRV